VNKFKIHTDGAARGNPGPAGAGWVVVSSEGRIVVEGYRYLGELTNNQAEYRALILALEDALEKEVNAIEIYSDSELMVRQLEGKYKVKNEGLKPLFDKARGILAGFESYSLNHVDREKNAQADGLANKAIDEHFGSVL